MPGDVVLIEADDAAFQWMLGQHVARNGLTLPEGGVDVPEIFAIVRAMTLRLRKAGSRASWMVTCNGVVVGLCSYKRPPAGGCAEIGYGIAPSQRCKGYATRAVALIVGIASLDPSVEALTAETAIDNLASQLVLERNGFTQTGKRIDPDDGGVILWTKQLR